jgi:hypothetical protein
MEKKSNEKKYPSGFEPNLSYQIITKHHTDMDYDFHELIVMISTINKRLKERFHRNTAVTRVRKSM